MGPTPTVPSWQVIVTTKSVGSLNTLQYVGQITLLSVDDTLLFTMVFPLMVILYVPVIAFFAS